MYIYIYRWKGNSTASRIHFKHWKNILISRLYEQFSGNDSAMVPEWLLEKLSNFSNINIYGFEARDLEISNM